MMTVDQVLAATPEGPYSWTMCLIQYELGKYDVQKNTPHATDLCAAFEALMKLADGSTAELNEREGIAKDRQRVREIIEGMENDYVNLERPFDGIKWHNATLGELKRRLEAER